MATRTDRRRERTREALIAAAQRILVEHGTSNVPIQVITDAADVGAGSFYNHFTTKEELFDAAVSAAIDAHSLWLDEALAEVTDPVEIFVASFRLTARLATTSPAVATLFVNSGFERLTSEQGLAPRALMDLQRMLDHGLLPERNAHLALATTAGCLFAYMRLRTQQPPSVTDEDADQLAEDLLVMLGLRRATARRVAHLPLPAEPPG
jgi:AcrR family transcriptional regulator